MRNIVANARLMQSPLTGQPRYFQEICQRLADPLAMVSPGRALPGTAGHLWEQTVLPARVGRGVLWSPSNTGPLLVPRQVVTIHDVSVFENPGWFHWKFAAWYRWLLPRLARVVRRVLTVSEFSRQQIVDVLGIEEQKVVVAPNAVDAKLAPASAAEIARVRGRYELTTPYVLAVGSVQPRKNLTRLVEAFALARPQLGDVQLVIAGGSFQVFSAAGLPLDVPGVRLAGYVPEEDLAALYSGAMVSCFPSLYEGFGMPALEAMACGAPVLTSRTSALPEVVGDAAWLVDPLDVEDMAAGLVRLVGDAALRQDLSVRGLARARHYSWEESAATVGRVLAEVAAER